MTFDPPAAPAAPPADPRWTLSSAHVDFLKLSVASAESHLRAYDTKAQITLAAFVLSLTPVWAMFNSVCAHGIDRRAVTAIVVLVVVTLVAYGATVWPASAPNASRRSGYFFLPGDARPDVGTYLAGLQDLDVPAALADEAFKLAGLRRVKAVRLKVALASSLVTYGLVLALLLTRTQCA